MKIYSWQGRVHLEPESDEERSSQPVLTENLNVVDNDVPTALRVSKMASKFISSHLSSPCSYNLENKTCNYTTQSGNR